MTQTTVLSTAVTHPYRFRDRSEYVLPDMMGVRWLRPTTVAATLLDAQQVRNTATTSALYAATYGPYSADYAHSRMIYQHPLSSNFTTYTGDPWNVDKEILRVGVLEPLNALNTLAGHSLVKWCQPWEVYQR